MVGKRKVRKIPETPRSRPPPDFGKEGSKKEIREKKLWPTNT